MIKMYLMPLSIIVFILSINFYLIALTTTRIPLYSHTFILPELRIWVGCTISFLVLSMLTVLLSGLTDTFSYSCFIVGLVCILAIQLIMVLNNMVIIKSPYPLMAAFDIATLITIFILYSYGSGNRY